MTPIWRKTAVLGLYTLSPTHFGTGQTTGAVDLPIARNATTGFPVLPATGIKGVLRDYVAVVDRGLSGETIKRIFGPEITGGDQDDGLSAGLMAFTEGRLLAYPVRSLTRPFFHVTCRLILEGLARDLRATGGDAALALAAIGSEASAGVLVADQALDRKPLVLEDLIYPGPQVSHEPEISGLAGALADLIPDTEADTRKRLQDGLVIIPDDDFAALMQSAVPVRARVKLTGGKTTDTWKNPETGETESGNLWHEEHVPSDCLFVSMIGERRDRTTPGGAASQANLDTLIDARELFQIVQIGGNETVGNGLCLCTMLASGTDGSST